MYVNKEFGSEEKPKARKRSVLIDKKNFYLKKKKERERAIRIRRITCSSFLSIKIFYQLIRRIFIKKR